MSDAPKAANGVPLPPLPKDHLDHPEQWATGGEPATAKQKGFIAVLEKQHPEAVPDEGINKSSLGKSEASEVIDKLKKGEAVESESKNQSDNGMTGGDAEQEGSKVASQTEEAKSTGDVKGKTEHRDTEETEGKEEKQDDAGKEGSSEQSGFSTAQKRKNSDVSTIETATKSPKAKSSSTDKPTQKEADVDMTESSAEKPATEDQDSSTKLDEAPADPDTSEPAAKKARTDAQDDSANNGTKDDTVPGDGSHLDHPENWATGDEPATSKQKGFLRVLAGKAGEDVGDFESLGKSEASAKIDELKSA